MESARYPLPPEGTPLKRHRYGGAGSTRLGEGYSWFQNIACSECNDDRPHLSNVILEQHVRLFRGAMEFAQFLFMEMTTPSSPLQHYGRIPSIGGYHLYGLARHTHRTWKSNTACVVFMLGRQNCSQSPLPPVYQTSAEGIA
ncbi:hypothetical protein AVEN_111584-1 [Araneus ventricosus]|uniref:Uncharacterized protein n=1 Tax=Araneus ventricosus TaxID=182803 RepID=A0A4Y2WDA2_ARAVE|nr:hypothetical protein AVEN_111584-1 [Araneus ventricosus]